MLQNFFLVIFIFVSITWAFKFKYINDHSLAQQKVEKNFTAQVD